MFAFPLRSLRPLCEISSCFEPRGFKPDSHPQVVCSARRYGLATEGTAAGVPLPSEVEFGGGVIR
jgi:hypothetical protein